MRECGFEVLDGKRFRKNRFFRFLKNSEYDLFYHKFIDEFLIFKINFKVYKKLFENSAEWIKASKKLSLLRNKCEYIFIFYIL